MRSQLFADTFLRHRGMTLEQASQGYGHMFGQLASPDEIDEVHRDMARRSGRAWKPAAERAAEVMSQHRPIGDIIHSRWARDHRELTVGDATSTARDLIDLANELDNNSRPNDVKLYRGANIDPGEQATRSPDMPISFTADRYAVRSFAAASPRASTFHAQAGTLRGIYLPDYVERQRTVGQGRRPESEWLIHPDSFGQS